MNPSSVQFDEDRSQFTSRRIIGSPERPAFVQLLIKAGIVKTEGQSYYALILISVISLAITIILLGHYVFGIGNPTKVRYNVPDQVKDQLTAQGVNVNN